jgi:membrane protease YdiL (CAAX protease family)
MNEQSTDLLETGRRPALWDWRDVLLISLASLFFVLAGTFALSAGLHLDNAGSGAEPSLLFNAVLAAVETFALAGSVIGLGLLRKKIKPEGIGLRWPGAGWLWGALAVALFFIPVMGLIALAIQWALGIPLQNPQIPFLAPDNFSLIGAAAMILFAGLAVPFAEELLFRGVIFRWLRDRWGFWTAALTSSLIFGLLHGDISVAGATFVMGLVLAWFYERSHSLWPSILIHAVNNSLKLVLLYALIASGLNIPGLQ